MVSQNLSDFSHNSSEGTLKYGNTEIARGIVMYLLVFGLFHIVCYVIVLSVYLNNREKFSNPFYNCVIALGCLDIYGLWQFNVYGSMCVMWESHPFGAVADDLMAFLFESAYTSSRFLVILMALNRYTAIVKFHSYHTMFREEVVRTWILIIFIIEPLIQSVPMFYGHRFYHEIPTGVVRMTNRKARFHLLWRIVVGGLTTYCVGIGCWCIQLRAFFIGKKRVEHLGTQTSRAYRLERNMLKQALIVNSLLVIGGMIQVTRLPLWFKFHLFQAYGAANPYIYLAFDRNVREILIGRARKLCQMWTNSMTESVMETETAAAGGGRAGENGGGQQRQIYVVSNAAVNGDVWKKEMMRGGRGGPEKEAMRTPVQLKTFVNSSLRPPSTALMINNYHQQQKRASCLPKIAN